MNGIQIGAKIAAKRKLKGVTQEELAGFLGVSKAAVSKWESGQSYPDITLLPMLATYFGTSVDEILGYEPQMSREDIRLLYGRLAKAFASEPFETVYSQCREYAKKYYSCWSLQFYIAALLINHANLAGARAAEIIEEAAGMFERVKREGSDSNLAREALDMQAYCYLALNQPATAIDLLDETIEPKMSGKTLLSKAYQMKGDSQKAKALLQEYIYTNIVGILGAFPDLLLLYTDDPAKMREVLDKVLGMAELFNISEIQPTLYFTIYLAAAQVFMSQGNTDGALDMLEKYTDVLHTPGLFPFRLHGNKFFDSLDSFFSSLDLGLQAPRSDEVIKRDIKNIILLNPVFDGLKNEARYQRLAKRLESLN